jgi:hypothetical protein
MSGRKKSTTLLKLPQKITKNKVFHAELASKSYQIT